MLAFERLAEEKIREAIAAGEFAYLPGKGQPLKLEEPPGIRPEDRLAYIVLKNSGFLPEYLQLRKEFETALQELEQFQARCRERLEKHLEVGRQLNLLQKRSQASLPQAPGFWPLKKREQNAYRQRGKRVPPRTLHQRLNHLGQTYQAERRWLRERLNEIAGQIEDTVQRLHAAMVEKEIRERREFLLIRHSPHFLRRDILAQFDRAFPVTFPECHD